MKRRHLFALVAVLTLRVIVLPAFADPFNSQEQDHHVKIPPEKIHHFEEQQLILEPFEAEDYVLAIGGGGEGVIGQLMGHQVVAIDISKRELEETPAGPLKVVMDARDLKFLDGSFNAAAAFFTLMYIDGTDHPRVFQEVHRVLAPGARFLIWDAVIGSAPSDEVEYVVVPVRVKLPGREISTGYGVRWPKEAHDLGYYKRLAEATGFVVGTTRTEGKWLYLELTKTE